MTNTEIDFQRYDNPQRAKAIWEAYLSDIWGTSKEIRERAELFVMKCSNFWDLDCGLDRIISNDVQPTGCYFISGARSNVDPDSNGSWGNSVRNYEDGER